MHTFPGIDVDMYYRHMYRLMNNNGKNDDNSDDNDRHDDEDDDDCDNDDNIINNYNNNIAIISLLFLKPRRRVILGKHIISKHSSFMCLSMIKLNMGAYEAELLKKVSTLEGMKRIVL